MLSLVIEPKEFFNEETNEFSYTKPQVIVMEHSLVAIAKWESKYHKPFFTVNKNEKRSISEWMDYFMFMTITQNVDPMIYQAFGKNEFDTITAYMEDQMTATWFSNQNGPKKGSGSSGKAITNEVIYAIMVELGIPFECQKWHINRLFTLIKVLQERSKEPSKKGRKETMSQYSSLNRQRRALMGSKG